METRFSTVICAPIYTRHDELSTQVSVGAEVGLKHNSSIHCDALMSIPKSVLTNYVGCLMPEQIEELNQALRNSLELS